VNYIPEDEIEEEFPKPSIKKRSIKDVVSVCPSCFYPSKYIPAVFGMPRFSCTNEECDWTGIIAVEVSLEDYQELAQKRKQEESESKNIE